MFVLLHVTYLESIGHIYIIFYHHCCYHGLTFGLPMLALLDLIGVQ